MACETASQVVTRRSEAWLKVQFLDWLVGEPADGRYPYWRLALRGCSQMCFQSNEITALFFIVAVLVASPISAAYLLVAILAAPGGRLLLGEKRSSLATGMHGLNPSLISLAIPSFFETGWTNFEMWGVLIVCVVLAIVLVHVLVAIAPFPIIIVPFLVIFWVLWLLEPHVGFLQPLQTPTVVTAAVFEPAAALFLGLGQGVLSPTILSGVLFLIGVLASSWRSALIAVLGAAIGGGVAAFYSHVDIVAVDQGLYGFNGVLAGVGSYSIMRRGLRLSILGALVATILIPFVSQFGVPSLSAPFVLTIWLLLALGWVDKRFFNVKPS